MKLHIIAIPIYIISLLLIHIAYLAVFLGFFVKTPIFVKYLNSSIQFFLCIILMIRFHPFREKYQLRSYDIMLIFASAFIIFTNLVLVQLIQLPMIGYYVNEILKMFGQTTHMPILQVSINGNPVTI